VGQWIKYPIIYIENENGKTVLCQDTIRTAYSRQEVLRTHNTGISRFVVGGVVVVADDDDNMASLRVVFQLICNILVNFLILFSIIYISLKHELAKSSPEK
jgi:hypothetical protein